MMGPLTEKKAHLMAILKDEGIDDSVLAVLEDIPREDFIPTALYSQAYENAALAISSGQTISQPYIVAYMTQILSVGKNHKVLEVGTGSGYQAVVLA